MVYLLPLLSYLAGVKNVFVRPPVPLPVWPGYDDKYRSRSYRFVQRKKGRVRNDGQNHTTQKLSYSSKTIVTVSIKKVMYQGLIH